MATHSSVLAWRIPGTGSLVGCRLWGLTESDTTKATQQKPSFSNSVSSSVHMSSEMVSVIPKMSRKHA